jgi:thiosulfate/3-mercaptopyruvate sulfurtransferase
VQLAREDAVTVQSSEIASPAILVDPETLPAQADDPPTLLIDAREPEAYRRGHLRDAVNLPPSSVEWSVPLPGGNEVHHLLAPADHVRPLLSFLGINPDSRIVIYDDGGGYSAARVFWILDYFAHPRLSVLDGGVPLWKSMGGKLYKDCRQPNRGHFVPRPDPDKIATFDTVRLAVHSGSAILLNSLPRVAFLKEAIPGSVNIPYTETFVSTRRPRLLDPTRLLRLFEQASIQPEREIILYCGIGYTASQLYFAARLLGYPKVRLYDGSLTDWKARGGALVSN